MNANDPEASIRAAYVDAKNRGLPDCWTCSIDKRNRRKWTAPTGRSCDSIPKALAISVELGLLPPDFPIQAGPNKRKRTDGKIPPMSKKKRPSPKLQHQDDDYAPGAAPKRRGPPTGAGGAAEKLHSAQGDDDQKRSAEEIIEEEEESSSEEEDDQSIDNTPPEPMNPEISLDGLGGTAAPTTVHWNPNSANGKLVGWTVRVAAPVGAPWEWLSGRVVLYDPYTHKHKIEWKIPGNTPASPGGKTKKQAAKTPSSWVWLRNEEHNLHIATRLVWAHVKGYAWWPALVREANTEDTAPAAAPGSNRSVQVEFFGTDEIANLRDTRETLRPFHPLEALDPVVAKHKKKRNIKAINLATAEWYTVRHTRNQAAIWFARKAWNMANSVSGQVPYVGKQVQVFRDDVNYPYGDTLTGRVHAYSHHQRKWLCSYEMSSKNAKYDASWLNLQSKQVSTRLLSRKAAKQQQNLDELTVEDLLPYLFGFDILEPEKLDEKSCEDLDQDELKLQMRLSELWRDRCHGCVEHRKPGQTLFECSVCKSSYHLACCDPPLTKEKYIHLLKDGKPLICSRCVTCRGCFQQDITFGSHQYTPTPTCLSFPVGQSLDMCSMCKDAYDRKQFCPNCAHTWDDVKYQKVRRQMEHLGRSLNNPTGPGRRRKITAETITIEDSASTTLTGRFSVDLEIPPGTLIDPSWYHPETVEWGFTEIEMLVCDACKVWVHAGCAGMSEDEYNETSEGDHPIYSKEFLCRKCCKKRALDLVVALQQEDRSGLFAVPVTEKDAPNYRDVIKEPMDLQTMLEKAEAHDYQNYAWVRECFELVVLNALTFNNFYTKVWNEAKRFYKDCKDKVFRLRGKAAPPGKYEKAIVRNFERAEDAKKKEADRVQVDESVEKKDLVAGAMAPASVTLPSLRDKPPDQASCVPHTEAQLKSVDALYCAWMDCCFTCGSSGASDTMLFCVDCGESYHSFCVNAPVHSMSKWSVAGWRCPNCKVCEISGDVPKDETSLIYCEMCDRAFSLPLLDPPLEKAPPGLWICGQCVDCKVCKNTADPRGASLKHWSRDPEKCFSCGGCDGLIDPASVPSCSVCTKLLRGDEPGLVNCVGCGSQVHRRCDARAERHAKSLENIPRALKSLEVQPPDTYLCPTCYEPAADNIPKSTAVERKDAYRLAWKAIESGEIAPGEDQSQVDLYNMLTDRIEWEIRGRWKHEYLSIIEDAMKFYLKARNEEGDPRSVVQLVFNRLVNLPLWEAQRALRFVAMARRSHWDTKVEVGSIQRIVIGAKLAAAYIDVACSVMRCEIEDHVRYPKRVEDLLEAPEDGEVFTLMNDTFEQTVGPADLDLCDVDTSTIGPSESDTDGKATSETDGNTAKDNAGLPTALAGWEDGVDIGQPGEWKDPRECCLCHLCGDDDAGLSHRASSIKEQSKWGLPVRLGRMLPMSDGCWIHTSCALWTSEVYEEETDGMIHATDRARSRGAQLKCFGCGRYGATVGCNKSNCSFNYHFACAKVCGAVFTSDKHVFCVNHKPAGTSNFLEKESFEIMKALMVAPDKKTNGSEKDGAESTNEDLCIRVGALVVHSFGAIEQKRAGFHSVDYITPPGYFATRIFWSCVEPRKRAVYILQVSENDDGGAEYSIIPGDNASEKISGPTITAAYSSLMERVKKVNASYFSHGDLFTTLPMSRRSRKKTFGLNGPQFFGFGLNHIRRRLESLSGVEAVVSPLKDSSPSYRFCFVQPSVDAIRDLQRRRAAFKAELALENISGCARTEGIKAVARSGGSGRITRALVRSAEELAGDTNASSSVTKLSDRNIYQAKYKKMKAVPMEQRLVARRSHIHGWGLFTKIDIPKNDPIVEYMGEVVRKPIADIREKRYEISGEGSCYMFRLDLHRVIDATMIGCMARFMNHSCSSNSFARVISVETEYGQDKKIVVFANRDITAGEEITYDYKFPVEDGSLRCTCGAPNCIGRLN